MTQILIIRLLPRSDYQSIWQAMREFTDQRTIDTPDEIWLLEHHPVFTQGQAGKAEHILNPKNIPIIQTDRGGQVTYHGPGQLMLYALLNLKRLNLGPRQLVNKLEKTVIDLLTEFNIQASTQCQAPGVYMNETKICSIGLRIRRGCSYHGIALNVDMNLKPFTSINPCGFQGLKMSQIRDFYPTVTLQQIQYKIIPHFIAHFGYTEHHIFSLEHVDE